jgi:hypothetical protein
VLEGRRGEEGDGLLERFLGDMVDFLPPCFGDRREQGEEVWEQATHLFGSLALRRGLSAGEVVEELQLLRREILRLLLPEALAGGGEATPVRDVEVLALNDLLDTGVVRASVAYIDELFFAHLQGSGVPEGVTQEAEEEIRSQLAGFRKDLGLEDDKRR